MARGTPDHSLIVGQQDQPVPQTITAPANYSFEDTIAANTTAYFLAISAGRIANYKCYLSKLIISSDDSATLQNFYLMEVYDSYVPFIQDFRQAQTHDLGTYEVMPGTAQALRLYITNNHPTLTRKFSGTLQYYMVKR
jgi:hypothetical protein